MHGELSLGAELAARVAVMRPDRVRSLTLISPTGLALRAPREGGRLLTRSPWSELAFRALSSRPSIHYFLSKSLHGRVDPELEKYAYATSHRPGARFAPLAFVAGRLFDPHAFDLYSSVKQPVMVLHDRDPYVRFDRLPELVRKAGWNAVRISPTCGIGRVAGSAWNREGLRGDRPAREQVPHWEQPEATKRAIARFWTLECEDAGVATDGVGAGDASTV